jgi:calpain-7
VSSSKRLASVRRLQLLYTYQDPISSSSDVSSCSALEDKDIWVILTRHLSDTRRAHEYVSLTVHAEDDDDWGVERMKTRDVEVKVSPGFTWSFEVQEHYRHSAGDVYDLIACTGGD